MASPGRWVEAGVEEVAAVGWGGRGRSQHSRSGNSLESTRSAAASSQRIAPAPHIPLVAHMWRRRLRCVADTTPPATGTFEEAVNGEDEDQAGSDRSVRLAPPPPPPRGRSGAPAARRPYNRHPRTTYYIHLVFKSVLTLLMDLISGSDRLCRTDCRSDLLVRRPASGHLFCSALSTPLRVDGCALAASRRPKSRRRREIRVCSRKKRKAEAEEGFLGSECTVQIEKYPYAKSDRHTLSVAMDTWALFHKTHQNQKR
ncbi:hypothetical protein TcasGA2_TC004737 [Tribolium castaneum]|uniref:Uncharacterized protein n=1 Tax=Tribolium castaneum TaxID=7070 RepID=D6W7A2_TRICA|nr:hypothetical protein TcasGA2_TC004737 [Tribolium castaneum]